MVATLSPEATNRSAIARPMPRLAPVTSTLRGGREAPDVPAAASVVVSVTGLLSSWCACRRGAHVVVVGIVRIVGRHCADARRATSPTLADGPPRVVARPHTDVTLGVCHIHTTHTVRA